jgi:hypothetical protein
MIKIEIGIQAGKIWEYLDKNPQECAVKDLKKALKLKDKDLYMALGWLCRENKILINIKEEMEFITLIY